MAVNTEGQRQERIDRAERQQPEYRATVLTDLRTWEVLLQVASRLLNDTAQLWTEVGDLRLGSKTGSDVGDVLIPTEESQRGL